MHHQISLFPSRFAARSLKRALFAHQRDKTSKIFLNDKKKSTFQYGKFLESICIGKASKKLRNKNGTERENEIDKIKRIGEIWKATHYERGREREQVTHMAFYKRLL